MEISSSVLKTEAEDVNLQTKWPHFFGPPCTVHNRQSYRQAFDSDYRRSQNLLLGDALALSILQDSRILCRYVYPKQCNLTFIQLQIEIRISVAMFS